MRKNDVLIKGTKEGIHVALGEGEDYLTLRRHLEERLGSYARYFNGTEVTLEVGRRHLTPSQLRELEEIITRKHGMRVLRVRTDNAGQGVAPAQEVVLEPALAGVVRRSLRSGQRVAYDGNVIVFGDVHAGAEIVASGDVLVLGNLFGMAHAGARGDEGSVIAALRLAPLQIRIGTRIGRAPDQDRHARPEPEMARVRDGQIVIERFASWQGNERRETAWAKSS